MTQTAYVVLKTEWQYNDEFYYRETDGGLPHRAFFDKAKAEAECLKQNLEKVRTRGIDGHIPEDGFYMVKDAGLRERLKLPTDEENYWEYQVPKTASDEDILALLKVMRMEFFVVKTVTIE